MLRRLGEFGAALAELGVLAELLPDLADFPGDGLPLGVFRRQQRLDLALFGRQRVELLADLDFLELAQGAQAHVEDRLGLHIGQLERCIISFCFGSSSLADDADHLVDVEIGDQVSRRALPAGARSAPRR